MRIIADRKTWESKAVRGALFGAALLGATLVLGNLAGRWWVLLPLIPAILIGLCRWKALSVPLRAVWWGLVLGATFAYGWHSIRIVLNNAGRPPEWDFLAFWLIGRVAATGQSFLDPQVLHNLAAPLLPSLEFTREILDVGLWYPPQTMLFSAPLGLVEPKTAYVLWAAVQSLALAADIFLAWKLFLAEEGQRGLLVSAALLLSLSATWSTFAFAQTNFLALLALLLFWRSPRSVSGGALLAVGICVKPVLAVLILPVILLRMWRSMFGVALGGILMTLLAWATFGTQAFVDYVSWDAGARLPAWLYTEMTNQSLLATLLRLVPAGTSKLSPLLHPAFLTCASVLVIATAWFIVRIGPADQELGLALGLPLGLLIYPPSLAHYSLFLFVPLLVVWARRDMLPAGSWSAAFFIGGVFALTGFRGGDVVFLATLICWVGLFGLGWLRIRHHRQVRIPAPSVS